MEAKTIIEHLEDARQKVERRASQGSDRLETNIFAEEIQRAKTANIETVRSQLPTTTIEPFGKVSFFPDYENPPNYDYWLELQREGFHSQPIPGLKCLKTNEEPLSLSRHLRNPYHFDNAKDVEEKFKIKILPHKNRLFSPIFAKTDTKHPNSPAKVYGFAKEDKGLHFVYEIGTAENSERPLNQIEIAELARPLLVKFIFGIFPPTEEEIKKALLKIHREYKIYLPRTKGPLGSIIQEINNSQEWRISWIEPEQLDYPMPRGVLYTYKDAKESELFENLEFGILKREERTFDPVLAGNHKGFKIPLCYWA